jgi:TonB-dependent SusC/RagA subfamily outer membrane receptor
MKIILIIFISIFCGNSATAKVCDSLPFTAKPPMKISKMNDKAVTIKIEADSSRIKNWPERNFLDRKPTVVQTKGEREAKQKRVIIRCGYLHGPDPLIVIDGVPTNNSEIAQLNPNNILDISILKNAVAESIYGCRASGGVILITTKFQNQKKIIVKDEEGNSLQGVTIAVSSSNGLIRDSVFLITDEKGIATLNKFKKGYSYDLRASHVGYENKTVVISTKALETEIILNKKVTNCSPVVVTGYGRTIRRTIHCGMHSEIVSRRNDVYSQTNNLYEIFPNPASHGSIINIQLPIEISGTIKIQLYDLSGHLVLQHENSSEIKNPRIQLPEIAAGNYHLILLNKKLEKLFAGKLVVL